MESYDKKQIIIVTVGVVLVMAVGFFRCKPLIAKAQQLRSTKADQELENIEIRTQMRELPKVALRMEKLREEVGDYQKKIPQTRDFAVIWEQIAEVMKSLGLKGQLFQPDQEVLGKEINSIGITIKCTGTFPQLFEFFNRLNGLERVVRIEKLMLINSKTEPGQVSMDAKAKIYYQFANQEKNKV